MIYNGIEMKEIPSFREGFDYSGYFVTKTGDVYTTHYRKGHAIKKMTPNKANSGYYFVVLYNGSRYHQEYIHRLVAMTYIPNPMNLSQVNHKDMNKLNNSVENLEWMTASENTLHAKRNCTRKSKTSSNAGCLYKDKILLGHFDSLQQAKIYCKKNFHASLCTDKTRNENKQHHLVFIRNDVFPTFDIDDYWEQEAIHKEKLYLDTLNRNKAEKGISGVLYQNGHKIGNCRSIREAESVLGVELRKVELHRYTCRDYEYISNKAS